jgi:hypothetical protein
MLNNGIVKGTLLQLTSHIPQYSAVAHRITESCSTVKFMVLFHDRFMSRTRRGAAGGGGRRRCQQPVPTASAGHSHVPESSAAALPLLGLARPGSAVTSAGAPRRGPASAGTLRLDVG